MTQTSSDQGGTAATKADSPPPAVKDEEAVGTTTIASQVVQKIAGISAREVSGVHELGGETARTFGTIRERIPGSGRAVTAGVAVEVGEKQAAIDLDVVMEYGARIVDVARAIRRNVISNVERMTGLEVIEVNIDVNDIRIPGEEEEEQAPRVE